MSRNFTGDLKVRKKFFESAAELEKDNIFTIPNRLCLLRISVSPLIGPLVVSQQYHMALAMFSLTGVTDLAGLAFIDSPISKSDVLDWRKMSEKFENQIPNWPPGTGCGYHGITFGWLVDQLVRRVDPQNRSLGQFFREEVAIPHNIDFYIGLPSSELYRVARIAPPTLMDNLKAWTERASLYELLAYYTARNDFKERVLRNPNWLLWHGRNGLNNPEVLAMEIGAGNGVGNARALAKMFALLNQGLLIKNTTILETVCRLPETNLLDIVINIPMTYSYGFMITQNPEGENMMGHSGYGCQNVRLDRKHDLVLAYVTNGLKPGMGDLGKNFLRLQQATYQGIGIN